MKSAEHSYIALDPIRNRISLSGPLDLDTVQRASCIGATLGMPDTHETNIIVKQAAGYTVNDVVEPVMKGFNGVQNALGGPRNLTTTLLGAGLAGLGGYAVGSAADYVIPKGLRALLPKKYRAGIPPTRFAPLLATLGAGVGALPGLNNIVTARNNGKSWSDSLLTNYPWNSDNANPPYEHKRASADHPNDLFTPSIPVDAFNRAIWSSASPNPFGTKDTFGDNSQGLKTPPPVAAGMSGLVAAAGAARNSSHVSPWDIAQVTAQAAAGGLEGAAIGLVTGKALGALANMSPGMQEYVKETGLWTGVLTTLADKIF